MRVDYSVLIARICTKAKLPLNGVFWMPLSLYVSCDYKSPQIAQFNFYLSLICNRDKAPPGTLFLFLEQYIYDWFILYLRLFALRLSKKRLLYHRRSPELYQQAYELLHRHIHRRPYCLCDLVFDSSSPAWGGVYEANNKLLENYSFRWFESGGIRKTANFVPCVLATKLTVKMAKTLDISRSLKKSDLQSRSGFFS